MLCDRVSFEHFFDFFYCLGDGLPRDTTEDWKEVITMRRVLTVLLLIGTLGVVDFASAQTPEELTKACQQGNAVGCFNLGVMYYNGQGVTQDNFKAVEFYQKTCDGQEAMGCFNLGVMYEKGDGVTQDHFKAVELYRQACDGKNALGCINLGYLYSVGKGVTQDYFKAAELWRQACDGKDAMGCKNYARLKTGKK